MCKYHKYIDYDGCFHSAETESLLPSTRIKYEYCPLFVYRWARAVLESVSNEPRDDSVTLAQLVADSCSVRAGVVRDQMLLLPCPNETYDDSVALRAPLFMSFAAPAHALAAVCNECGKWYAELNIEWESLCHLMAVINGNISRNVYLPATAMLRDGSEPPAFLRTMLAPVPVARMQLMNTARLRIFAPSMAENVFTNREWECARWYQRVLFYHTLRGWPLPAWTPSARGLLFGLDMDGSALLQLTEDLRHLLAAQDMGHVDPFFLPNFPVVPADLQLDILVPATAAQKGHDLTEEAIAGWATHHQRVNWEDAMLSNTNAFALYPDAVARAVFDHCYLPRGDMTRM